MLDCFHNIAFRGNGDNLVMKTKLDKPLPYIYPIPIILAGALVNGRPNYATIGDTGIIGISPALVFISSHVNHYTNVGILQHQTFSINIPSTDLLEETDYCGIVSGAEVDKSRLFTNFYGELETAPMIAECPVNLECRVIQEVTFDHRQVFIGEVCDSYVSIEALIEDGERNILPLMSRLDPIIYALDNQYYRIGDRIGTGYQEGQLLSVKR